MTMTIQNLVVHTYACIYISISEIVPQLPFSLSRSFPSLSQHQGKVHLESVGGGPANSSKPRKNIVTAAPAKKKEF